MTAGTMACTVPACLFAAIASFASFTASGATGTGIDRVTPVGTVGRLLPVVGRAPSGRVDDTPAITTRTSPRVVRLNTASTLHPDDGIGSADGRFALLYRQDGNLVLYGEEGPVWDSGTAGTAAGQVRMQDDGDLVILNAHGRTIWSTNSAGNPRATLELADDGTLVVRRADGSTAWERTSR